MRICTGEVWVRSKRRSRSGFLLLIGDDKRVLRIAGRVVRRKIERFEIVVVGFNFGSNTDRVAHVFKDANDFVHGANQRMFRAERGPDAG